MERIDAIRVFLSLIDAAENGAVTDTLWLHKSDQSLFEFLYDKCAVEAEWDGGDFTQLRIALESELARYYRKSE